MKRGLLVFLCLVEGALAASENEVSPRVNLTMEEITNVLRVAYYGHVGDLGESDPVRATLAAKIYSGQLPLWEAVDKYVAKSPEGALHKRDNARALQYAYYVFLKRQDYGVADPRLQVWIDQVNRGEISLKAALESVWRSGEAQAHRDTLREASHLPAGNPFGDALNETKAMRIVNTANDLYIVFDLSGKVSPTTRRLGEALGKTKAGKLVATASDVLFALALFNTASDQIDMAMLRLNSRAAFDEELWALKSTLEGVLQLDLGDGRLVDTKAMIQAMEKVRSTLDAERATWVARVKDELINWLPFGDLVRGNQSAESDLGQAVVFAQLAEELRALREKAQIALGKNHYAQRLSGAQCTFRFACHSSATPVEMALPIDLLAGDASPKAVYLKLLQRKYAPSGAYKTPQEFLDGCLGHAGSLKGLRTPDPKAQPTLAAFLSRLGKYCPSADNAVVYESYVTLEPAKLVDRSALMRVESFQWERDENRRAVGASLLDDMRKKESLPPGAKPHRYESPGMQARPGH